MNRATHLSADRGVPVRLSDSVSRRGGAAPGAAGMRQFVRQRHERRGARAHLQLGPAPSAVAGVRPHPSADTSVTGRSRQPK